MSVKLCQILLLILFLSGCEKGQTSKGNATTEKGLIVAVAANVQFAVKSIEVAYEAQFNTDITVIIGSSGKLTAQIKQGAPYDLFLSANLKYPETLHTMGLTTGKPEVYAFGSLVVWTTDNSMALTEDLSALTDPGIRKIAIANPQNAPYGEQAVNAFRYFNLEETIIPKLVYGESIAQTNQYILTKNCEAGLTAKSVVFSPEMQGKGKWVEVDPKAYESIAQGVIMTKYGANHHQEQAEQFYAFLFSPQASQIFRDYGYTIPGN